MTSSVRSTGYGDCPAINTTSAYYVIVKRVVSDHMHAGLTQLESKDLIHNLTIVRILAQRLDKKRYVR